MFKAAPLEYRFRFLIHVVVFALGFSAPWNYVLHLDPPGANAHLWGVLATALARFGIGNIATAFNLLLSLAIVSAVAGAFLRTWGAAYLGSGVVQSHTMHTAEGALPSGRHNPAILQDGPFRYLRNPLYLGTFLHTLALALLMPLSGAIFTILAIATLQIRLILAEEWFLSQRLGAPYLAYCALVPRIIPDIVPRGTRLQAGALDSLPRWPQAILGEIYFWAAACSFAVVGWRYDETLLLECVIVSFGASLVLRAFSSPAQPALPLEDRPER